MNETDISQSIKSIKLGKIINLKKSDIIPKFSYNKKNYIYDYNPFTTENNYDNIFHSFNNEIRQNNDKKRQMTYFVNKKSKYLENENITNENLYKNRKSYYKNAKFMLLDENKNNKKHDIKNEIGKNRKSIKRYIHTEINHKKDNLDKNDNNSDKKLDEKDNNLFKNLYYIKTPINNSNRFTNNNSINTLSD